METMISWWSMVMIESLMEYTNSGKFDGKSDDGKLME